MNFDRIRIAHIVINCHIDKNNGNTIEYPLQLRNFRTPRNVKYCKCSPIGLHYSIKKSNFEIKKKQPRKHILFFIILTSMRAVTSVHRSYP